MKVTSLLFSFQGRINRLPYWLVTLVVYGIGSGSGQASTQYGPDNPMTIVPGIITLVTFVLVVWIGLAVQVKRWHDRDKTGWWALINLIPVIGQIWVLIQCGILKGTEGENRFGKDPVTHSQELSSHKNAT